MMKTRCSYAVLSGLLLALQGAGFTALSQGGSPVYSLGNQVWIDLDENGLRDAGEPGLGGVVVHLLDCFGNRVATTVTEATGFYLFPVVAPGEYQQSFALPPGYIFTTLQAGSDPSIDNDADADGLTHCFVFSGTGNQVNVDAGILPRGIIQGQAWYDRNRNGICEKKEFRLAGIPITLLDCGGQEIATTLTGSNGVYRFTHIPLGVYRIGSPSMDGLALTRANATTDTIDSDLLPASGASECLALVASQPLLTVDLGIRDGYGCVTFAQADWGAPPAESHLSTLLVDNFPLIYKRGLKLGLSTNQVMFLSAQAIINFLPATGSPSVLATDHTDPLVTEAGEFAGNVLALKLNVDFSLRRKTAKGLASLKIEPGHKLAKMRVTTVLALAQKVLSGRIDLLPAGCTLDDLNDAIERINHNFDCGMMDLGFLGR